MRWLKGIHGGIRLCVLLLGTVTMLFSQDVQHEPTSRDQRAAAVQHSASSPRSEADSPQENCLEAGAHPDNSAVSLAGSQNAAPHSAGEPPTSPLQLSTPTDGEEAQRLQH